MQAVELLVGSLPQSTCFAAARSSGSGETPALVDAASIVASVSTFVRNAAARMAKTHRSRNPFRTASRRSNSLIGRDLRLGRSSLMLKLRDFLRHHRRIGDIDRLGKLQEKWMAADRQSGS